MSLGLCLSRRVPCVQDGLKAIPGYKGGMIMDLEGKVTQVDGDMDEGMGRTIFNMLVDSNGFLGAESKHFQRLSVSFSDCEFSVVIGDEILVAKKAL